jgi:hypothetical protein
MRFFIRTVKPSQLKSFIDKSLNFNINLEQIEAGSMPDPSDSEFGSWGDWYEWYTYADQGSFDHCLYVAVIEQCVGLHTGFLELHSACLDIDLAGKAGRGLSFDRMAFMDHLEKYRASAEWFDGEGEVRLPYPEELVAEGKESSDYEARFAIVHL